jgi:hydrogenase maturation protein HypF
MARRVIAVSGIVQGVGFRPFVHELAARLGLAGSVRNDTGGVHIEIEGAPEALDRFLSELTSRPPPLAQIAAVQVAEAPPRGERGFHIEASAVEPAGSVFISPDVATCDECLAELFDPADRRFRYPFLNCTRCGPRLTITRAAPYDRVRTTMAAFPMCPACRAEYEDPADRRFHAQPTACPACGPRLEIRDAQGRPIPTEDALARAVAALRGGAIGALKGLGGYHLACAAGDERAVAELRRRKHRDEKPFALMVRDLTAAEQLCEISPAERALLQARRAPIVLLYSRPGAAVAEAVAPGNPCLGVMLPYTPLHHLLLHDLGGLPLVMTSGNRSDEPIAYEDADALKRLRGIADFFLIHDRPIHVRCDDSVTRVAVGEELPLRRSRGHAPQPLALPFDCPRPLLALGGQLKATFALARGRHAFLSHHLGDLDHYQALRAYVAGIAHYEDLFALRPEVLVHDLHPDYASTRYAAERAAGAPELGRLAVQHHHAHMASCMAEHGLAGPVIGVSLDGTGYGTDAAIWGGEFLTGGYREFRRAAHLRYVALPGGDQAIREPWRVAVAHLRDAGISSNLLVGRVPDTALRLVEGMIARGVNAPHTSSAGRLFDAVAALAGVRTRVSYEGQAAMELEWLAMQACADAAYSFALSETARPGDPLQIDTRPLIAGVAEDVRRGDSAAVIGRRFHAALAEMIVRVCTRLRVDSGLSEVVLSGGVFMNVLLLGLAVAGLEEAGFRVYRHRLVPPNDGGLCLGQLAVAAARLGSAGDSTIPANRRP